ncbi:putative mitochondrial import inner membrane translocase subunit [Clavispora lusitaniae]|uniref:Mitochondrial import inner membrane translocase subunit TIM50 n=1 Tax=Clavispora lusitaniae TaxID=36911 RepID=A0AA91T214_CLALS|nr:putative mitochondrial import inner membrane translocase subunit [Clavispora lusitaniae]
MLASKILRALPLHGASQARLAMPVVRSNFGGWRRFYAEKKDEKPQSILTDDMLAKAGFEDEPKNEENDDKSKNEKSARRRRKAQTSKDIQREKYANWFYISTLFGTFAGVGWMCRDWDSDEEQKRLDASDIGNGYTPKLMYDRFNKRFSSLFTFFSEPAFENLLPPPPPEAYRRPLTLVLSLDDLLIHSEWDTKNGWRTAKRPGLDYFLGYLSQYYEIVIFGSNSQMYSEKTVAKLDPLRAYIQYALFREACRYKDGKLIKDLNLLNRDLAKTVAIDVNEESLCMNPENSIILKPWDGKPDDTLVKLIPLLEYLATQPVKDVRPILNSFEDKSNIIAEYEKREAQLRARWREDNKDLLARAHKPNAGSFFASLMGIPQSSVNREPKMPLDIIREHGQMQYESLQKYLKENEAKFLEEERKMKEEYGKVTLNKLMTEGMPTAEEIAKAQAEKAALEASGSRN